MNYTVKIMKGIGVIAFLAIAVCITINATQFKGIPFKPLLNNIESLASGEVVTTCTATYTCVDEFNNPNGSISCTGENCSRGEEKEGIIFITYKRYVECDGKRTYC